MISDCCVDEDCGGLIVVLVGGLPLLRVDECERLNTHPRADAFVIAV